MITLTTPATINSVLGGNAPVSYDKMVLSQITFQPVAMDVAANITLTASSDADMQPITGTFSVKWATKKLTVSVPQLDFYRQITLSVAQQNAVAGVVYDAQNAL